MGQTHPADLRAAIALLGNLAMLVEDGEYDEQFEEEVTASCAALRASSILLDS